MAEEEGESKYRRLTDAEWAQIVTKFELGTHTVSDLAKEYNCHYNAISRGLNKRGARKGCRANEIAEVTADAAKDARRARLDEIESMKGRYLKYNDFIARLAMQQIQKKIAAGASIVDVKDEIRVLKDLATTIARTRDENYNLYGLYNDDVIDDELPELILTEYTPEELEAIQDRFEEEAAAALSRDTDADGAGKMPFEEDDED